MFQYTFTILFLFLIAGCHCQESAADVAEVEGSIEGTNVGGEDPDDVRGDVGGDDQGSDATPDVVTMEAVGVSSVETDDISTDNSTESLNATVTTVRPKRVACLLPESKVTDHDADAEDADADGRAADAEAADRSSQHNPEQSGVRLVNGSHFLHVLSEQFNSNVTNRTTPAKCMLVFFFAPWCPFSAEAAPHFNAFGRIYSDLPVLAVDSSKYPGVNTQFGILALPTILLFHNSKPVSKFNHSTFNLDNYAQFISTLAGIEASEPLEVTETDFTGPLPTTAEVVPDYCLYLAWIFTVVCALGYFGKSSFSRRLIESLQNNWREAEIQHEHTD